MKALTKLTRDSHWNEEHLASAFPWVWIAMLDIFTD